MTPELLPARMAAKITVDEAGCWLWTGWMDRDGYGRTWTSDGTKPRTHRVSYEQLVGPIPDGFQIDHLCRVRACCNPEHLEAVTREENNMRAARLHGWPMATGAYRCGHQATPENREEYLLGVKQKHRCRTCSRARARDRRRRQGEAPLVA